MKNRREFLKTSAAFMGVLGAFGLLGGEAFARKQAPLQVQADARTLKLVLDDALVTRDMKATLGKFGSKLSLEQRTALEKFNRADLEYLGTLNSKLGDAKALLQGHEGGLVY